jgi:hypothetical protein
MACRTNTEKLTNNCAKWKCHETWIGYRAVHITAISVTRLPRDAVDVRECECSFALFQSCSDDKVVLSHCTHTTCCDTSIWSFGRCGSSLGRRIPGWYGTDWTGKRRNCVRILNLAIQQRTHIVLEASITVVKWSALSWSEHTYGSFAMSTPSTRYMILRSLCPSYLLIPYRSGLLMNGLKVGYAF